MDHTGHECVFLGMQIEGIIIYNLRQLMVGGAEKNIKLQACITAVTSTMVAKKEHFFECVKHINENFDEYIAKMES